MGWGSGIAVSYGVGHRRGSDPKLLWLWHRPEATAPIGPLAWELPYTPVSTLEYTKRPKKEKKSPKLNGNHKICRRPRGKYL